MDERRTYLRLAALVLLSLLAVSAVNAQDASGQRLTAILTFDQPTEPLAVALRDLARRAGIQIVFAEKDLKGTPAPALSGKLSVEQALDALLRGTQLEFVSNGTAVAVRPKAARTTVITPTPAVADRADSAESEQATEIQEVTVTAQRRSERIQTVPVSVTALSGDVLADKRITQPDDLPTLVPNLQALTGLGPGAPVYALRGISLNDSAPNQSSPIGIYYDEVYKGSLALFPVGLYDLSRVEVLRGPQGTLYGKNTTAGAINYITNAPTFTPEAEVNLGSGNYGLIESSGFVNGPLTDSVAGRLAYTYRYADGWFKNLAPGRADMDSVHQLGVRGSLLFHLADSWDATLRLELGRQTPQGLAYATAPDTTAGVAYPTPRVSGRLREVYQSDAVGYIHKMDSVSLNNTWRLSGDLSLISVTSYDHGSTQAPVALQDPYNALYGAPNISGKADQFTEDIRLASTGTAPLGYIVGAYFNREQQSGGQIYQYYAPGTGACDPNAYSACDLINSLDQLKQSGAIYADATYRFDGGLTLRGGVRYTHDEASVHNYNAGYYDLDAVTPARITIVDGRAAATTNNVAWKAGLEYAPTPDAMLYYTHSTGFRGASFNFVAFDSLSEIQPSHPETIVADEVGFKTQWFDRRITLNGAAFYYNYKNYVADNFVPPGLLELYGIPDTRIYGGELEWAFLPMRRLRFSGGLGVTNATIRNGELSGAELSGNRLPITSKVSVSSAVEWTAYEGQMGSIRASADTATFIGRRYFDLFNTPQLASGGYTVLNAQLKLRTTDDHYGVTIWGRNLANRYYYTANYSYASYGFDTPVLGDPRTYGLSVDARF